MRKLGGVGSSGGSRRSDEEIAETARGFSTYGLQTEKPKGAEKPAVKAGASAKASARRIEKRVGKKR